MNNEQWMTYSTGFIHSKLLCRGFAIAAIPKRRLAGSHLFEISSKSFSYTKLVLSVDPMFCLSPRIALCRTIFRFWRLNVVFFIESSRVWQAHHMCSSQIPFSRRSSKSLPTIWQNSLVKFLSTKCIFIAQKVSSDSCFLKLALLPIPIVLTTATAPNWIVDKILKSFY